jgi:hypothetical protein
MKTTRSGFQNEAADKIWCDHLGNNAFVWHRDQCPACQEVAKTAVPGRHPAWCPEGERIFNEMIDDVLERVKEALENQN